MSPIGPLCADHAIEFWTGVVGHLRFLAERRRIIEQQPINFDELELDPLEVAV